MKVVNENIFRRLGVIGSRRNCRASAGFSRIDLCALLAVLGVVAFLNVAAVSSSRSGSDGALCLANLRELTRAWQQFGVDHGQFPPNPEDGNIRPGFHWAPGFAGVGNSGEFNSDLLKDPTRSLLFPYLTSGNADVFRCPADRRMGLYQGTDPARIGTTVPAARSYAMSQAVGMDPYTGNAVNGHWLDNNHTHFRGQTWRTYGRFDDIVDPIPAKLAVLLDEDERSINDGGFAFGMEREELIDWPGTRHSRSGTISFADGHVELHRWVDERTVVIGSVTRRSVPGSPDYQWLRERISARIRQ